MSQTSALLKYTRAANYLAVAQIYLRDNVFLERPLEFSDIKPRLLGHWGTCPGISFVYAQLDRLIARSGKPHIYIVGPGHGFPAIQAGLFLEGSLTAKYPERIPFSRAGITEICRGFSAPYGFPSHSNPGAPGAILEGGELGYSLGVATGAVLDNPSLTAVCLVGDGEAETGPLAASWQAHKLLSPETDGAVLPVLHLNGYKISGPTLLARTPDSELIQYFTGLGYDPLLIADTPDIYERATEAFDQAEAKIALWKKGEGRLPMILLRTKKGWTGPTEDHGNKLEGNCLSHQVVLGDCAKNAESLRALETWLRSYHFEELIHEENGTLVLESELASIMPTPGHACGTQRLAYGGDIHTPLTLPPATNHTIGTLPLLSPSSEGEPEGVPTEAIIPSNTTSFAPGSELASPMALAGEYLADVLQANKTTFRLMSPDETYSNKLDAAFRVTHRVWSERTEDFDKDLAPSGQVLEMLSEHTLFSLLHGYTATGRQGVFASYEAFVQVIASQADQYAKFIKASREVPWRNPLPGLTIILTSLLERQDHNGFSHQNPSFISNLLEKDGELLKVSLPPDANCMVYALEEALQAKDKLSAIVVGKNDLPLWLTPEQAKQQMKDGILTWDFASDTNPDLVLAASGDYVTRETLAGLSLLKELLPDIRLRFINISELTALGVGDDTVPATSEYLDHFFTSDKPVIYNFHGYPATIKKLLYDYSGSHRVKVLGYLEEGSTTTPFDMEVRNRTSRLHIALYGIEALLKQGRIDAATAQVARAEILQRLASHHAYILQHGTDPVEYENWHWTQG